jgi:hypothetical protein
VWKHAYPGRWKAGRARYICWEFPADVAIRSTELFKRNGNDHLSRVEKYLSLGIHLLLVQHLSSSFPFSHPLILGRSRDETHHSSLTRTVPGWAEWRPSGSSGWTPPVVTGDGTKLTKAGLFGLVLGLLVS